MQEDKLGQNKTVNISWYCHSFNIHIMIMYMNQVPTDDSDHQDLNDNPEQTQQDDPDLPPILQGKDPHRRKVMTSK